MKKTYLIVLILVALCSCKSKLIQIETNTPSTFTFNEKEYTTPAEIDLRINKEYTFKFYSNGYHEKIEVITISEDTNKVYNGLTFSNSISS